MNDTHEKIAAGLEHAFASNGFTEIGVDGLRLAAQVSLRTLYKYCPSREDMVLTALEHRHTRYINYLSEALPHGDTCSMKALFERVGSWMAENASRGCLFHSAAAAHPESTALQALLQRHKQEVANLLANATGLPASRNELMLLHEGVVHSWPILGEAAVVSAIALGDLLLQAAE